MLIGYQLYDDVVKQNEVKEQIKNEEIEILK